MDLLHPRCWGLDVGERDAKVCVRTGASILMGRGR